VGTNYVVGAKGGTNDVTLTVEQMPPHTHGHWSPKDNWGLSGAGISGNREYLQTASTGGGQAHENRPPYYALAYIMRVR
jgi:microcystin-dependent protein